MLPFQPLSLVWGGGVEGSILTTYSVQTFQDMLGRAQRAEISSDLSQFPDIYVVLRSGRVESYAIVGLEFVVKMRVSPNSNNNTTSEYVVMARVKHTRTLEPYYAVSICCHPIRNTRV